MGQSSKEWMLKYQLNQEETGGGKKKMFGLIFCA